MKSNFYISLGIWVALLPFLGIPGPWRNTLVTLSGVFLALAAAGPSILRKLQPKQKIARKKREQPIGQPVETPSKDQEVPLQEGELETGEDKL